MERKLAEIWAEVLKLERVGRHDNFFALGGHSLLAVRVMTRLRQAWGVEVGIRELFAHPVLAELVRSVEQAKRTELPPITRAERSECVPLSFAQQRLWFLAQMEGVSETYHIPLGIRLRGNWIEWLCAVPWTGSCGGMRRCGRGLPTWKSRRCSGSRRRKRAGLIWWKNSCGRAAGVEARGE